MIAYLEPAQFLGTLVIGFGLGLMAARAYDAVRHQLRMKRIRRNVTAYAARWEAHLKLVGLLQPPLSQDLRAGGSSRQPRPPGTDARPIVWVGRWGGGTERSHRGRCASGPEPQQSPEGAVGRRVAHRLVRRVDALMNPVIAVVIALWPLWAAIAVAAVAFRVEARHDRTWADQNRLPGSLSEGRDR